MQKINKPGLYVHIPFCNKICSYCNFTKLIYLEKFSKPYLELLKKELIKYNSFNFDSIYIGGGTPSSLSYNELEYLFEMLIPYQNQNTLITMEINPDIDYKKIELFKKYHVQRVSIGVQSFNKNILKLINRDSNYDEINDLIYELNKNDIFDINVDLIYGFNIENKDILKQDLDLFTSLNITHISTYCLQLEESTILKNNHYQELNDEDIADQYEYIVSYLKNKGFNRYEVSNFSKENYESKHNLIYWNNQEYGGVGLGSSSYIDNVRRTNTKNMNEYLKGNYLDYEEILNEEDKEFYFIMLGLRKEKGISLIEYKKLFNNDFLIKYQNKIDYLLKNNDIIIENNCLKLKEDKFFILDYILRKILF